MKIRLVIPKGSLEEATFRLMGEAWTRVRRKARSYNVYLDDPDIHVKMMRPQEIPNLVAEGLYDIGITGQDWVRETGAGVEQMLDLEYGRIKLVAAFPDSFAHDSLDQMVSYYASRNMVMRVSSEYLTTASAFIMGCDSYRKHFGKRRPLLITPWLRVGDNEQVRIHLSFGATEAKPPDDVDAIIDVTETGTTMVQNGLKIADTILESSACLVGNRKSLADPIRGGKMQDIASLLRGAVTARKYLHIYFNVHADHLESVIEHLPSLKKPTVSPLSDKNWHAVNTIVRKADYYALVPLLSRMVQGLVVHEPRLIFDEPR